MSINFNLAALAAMRLSQTREVQEEAATMQIQNIVDILRQPVLDIRGLRRELRKLTPQRLAFISGVSPELGRRLNMLLRETRSGVINSNSIRPSELCGRYEEWLNLFNAAVSRPLPPANPPPANP